MVSRTAVALVAFAALAASVYAQTDGSLTGQYLNKLVPEALAVTSIAGANFGLTPSTPAVPGRKMLASNTFNKAATPNAEFNTSILQFAASNKTPFSFIGEVIETLGTEVADATYIFGKESKPFLDVVTKSGTNYTFLQALIYTPQEANPVPFVSKTGFLNADGSNFEAHIKTTEPTIFAPNVAVRFDYSQVTTTGPELVSLYYSDRFTTTPSNPNANLKQTFGIYIGLNGQVYYGQTSAGASGTPSNSGAPSTPVTPSTGKKLF